MRSSPATTRAGRPPSSAASSSDAIKKGRSEEDDEGTLRRGRRLTGEALDVLVLYGSM